MATKVITDTRKTRKHEALTDRHVSEMRSAFEANPAHRLMQNAVAQHDVNDVALDRTVVTGADHTFSNVLDDWSPTHQGKSGRCWLFAGLNLLRVDAMKAMNVKTGAPPPLMLPQSSSGREGVPRKQALASATCDPNLDTGT